MIPSIKRAFSRLSLFWRYFFLLAALLALFLLSVTAMTRRFAGILRSSRLEQTQASFEKNCALFSREVFKTYALPAVIAEMDDFSATVEADDLENLGYLFRFSPIRDSFNRLCSVQDLPAESFIYFRRSGVFVTRSRIFPDRDSFFGSYLIYAEQAPDLAARKALPRLHVLPASDVSVNGRTASPYLTVLVRDTTYNTLYGFLYPCQDVLDAFQMDTLPEGTVLSLTYKDGTQLFSGGGEETEPSVHLEKALPALSCSASLSVPLAYFDAVARGARTAASLSLLAVAAIGAALCVLLALLIVRPFRRLLRAHAGGIRPRGNEFTLLDEALTSARQETDRLQSMFLSSLLIRSAAGLAVSEEECAQALAAFPVFRQSMRAAVICDLADEDEPDGSCSIDCLLRPCLPEQFLCRCISPREAILLLPDTEQALTGLRRLLTALNGGGVSALRFVCGVGEPFLGLNEAGASIRQAQICVPDGEELMIAFPLPAPDDASVLFEPERLRRALAEHDRAEVLSIIEQSASSADRGGAPSPEELFYRILALLRDCAHADRLSFDEYEKLTYRHSHSPASNLRRLKPAANRLFSQSAAAQRPDRQDRCRQIVQYIRDNFSDPSLCLASLSRQFHVSERFVYHCVQEATGMNVSSFLAQTRMTEAARLLRQTQETVGSVAEKCGYPVESTFYRNFRKYYHMTPAEYKALLGAEGDNR